MDGHRSGTIRTWMGDSRGHWEGNTLVVETTSFNGRTPVRNTSASEDLRLVGRFSLADAHTLGYPVTINHPKTWTRPWTLAFPLRCNPEYTLCENACYEGNYYMYNALTGARAEEKGRKN